MRKKGECPRLPTSILGGLQYLLVAKVNPVELANSQCDGLGGSWQIMQVQMQIHGAILCVNPSRQHGQCAVDGNHMIFHAVEREQFLKTDCVGNIYSADAGSA